MGGMAAYTVVLDAECPLSDCRHRPDLSAGGHEAVSRQMERQHRGGSRQEPGGEAAGAGGQDTGPIREAMRRAIPDCIIGHFDHITDKLRLPDPDDRHVLAAAIVGHADAIVTFNLKDFPTDYVRQFGIEVLHPDDFVMNQVDLNQVACLAAIKAMRAGWNSPAYTAMQLVELYSSRPDPDEHDFLRSAIKLI